MTVSGGWPIRVGAVPTLGFFLEQPGRILLARSVCCVHFTQAQDQAFGCAASLQEFRQPHLHNLKTARLQLMAQVAADFVMESGDPR